MYDEFRNCSWKEYCDLDGITQSALKSLLRSPSHYLQAAADEKRAPTDAMLRGTAAHTATLEPKRFMLEYALWEGKVRRGKVWEQFQAENEGKTILRPEDFFAAFSMRDAVRGHPEARHLFVEGKPEVAMLWQDEATGLGCKGRVDWIISPPRWPTLVGLKTARDASPREFQRQAAKLGYHMQWAYYHDGYQTLTGVRPRMVEVVVENAKPHDVVVYEIPDGVLDQGRRAYRELLAKLKACVEADHWPGQADSVMEFELPPWAMDDEVESLIIGGEEHGL